MQNEAVIDLYKKFYAQRSVLGEAPALSIDTAQFPTENQAQQMETELVAVVSYLLGVSSIKNYTTEQLIQMVEKGYGEQPFWKNLLLDYCQYQLDREKDELMSESFALQMEVLQALDALEEADEEKKRMIQAFADKIKAAKFPVDAVKLVRNFLKMSAVNAEKARETLITNPAYFAPIQTQNDMGKVVLSPKEATDTNKRLGKFLKSLKN